MNFRIKAGRNSSKDLKVPNDNHTQTQIANDLAAQRKKLKAKLSTPSTHGRRSTETGEIQSPQDWVLEGMKDPLFPEYPLPIDLSDMDPGSRMTLHTLKLMHLVFATAVHAGKQEVFLKKKTISSFISASDKPVASKDTKAAVQRLSEVTIEMSTVGILDGKSQFGRERKRDTRKRVAILSGVNDSKRLVVIFKLSDDIFETLMKPRMWTYIGLDKIHKFRSSNGLSLFTAFSGLIELRKRHQGLHKFSVRKHSKGIDVKKGKAIDPKFERDWDPNGVDVALDDLSKWVGMSETIGGTEPKRIQKRVIQACKSNERVFGSIVENPEVFQLSPGAIFGEEFLGSRKTFAAQHGYMAFSFTEPKRPAEYMQTSREATEWFKLASRNPDLYVSPAGFQIALRKAGIFDGVKSSFLIHNAWKHFVWQNRNADIANKHLFKKFSDELVAAGGFTEIPNEELKQALVYWECGLVEAQPAETPVIEAPLEEPAPEKAEAQTMRPRRLNLKRPVRRQAPANPVEEPVTDETEQVSVTPESEKETTAFKDPYTEGEGPAQGQQRRHQCYKVSDFPGWVIKDFSVFSEEDMTLANRRYPLIEASEEQRRRVGLLWEDIPENRGFRPRQINGSFQHINLNYRLPDYEALVFTDVRDGDGNITRSVLSSSEIAEGIINPKDYPFRRGKVTSEQDTQYMRRIDEISKMKRRKPALKRSRSTSVPDFVRR
ncbi:hypothetical protein ACS3QZ_19655 (plasmid) [Shimia sp. W99]